MESDNKFVKESEWFKPLLIWNHLTIQTLTILLTTVKCKLYKM